MQHESAITNTTSSSSTTISSSFRMSVNVRLCGSIPRKDMKCLVPSSASNSASGAPCSLSECLTSQGKAAYIPYLANTNGSGMGPSTLSKTSTSLSVRLSSMVDALSSTTTALSGGHYLSCTSSMSTGTSIMRGILADKQQQTQVVVPPQQQSALSMVVEPPSWAVPAQGESRLEPACDSIGRQNAVDLTKRACFRIGCSPNMDVQLLHATSSRRHALLFHHSNGSCYVVDCGSAHGTYVNGVRIETPSNGGVVVPHKVKRGALIRFGGPGAPCFLLKSFTFHLSEIDGSVSPDMGELVRRNTRLNALGRTASECFRDSLFPTIDTVLGVPRKRSFDSLDSRKTFEVVDLQQPCGKRLRCSSPPPSPEEPPIRLVSPDLPPMTITKRVTFSEEPPKLFYPALVTPEELSCEEDN